MAKKGNKYKIGALALIAIFILIFGLLSLGVLKYFEPVLPIMTATSNSVQGLSVGSNVKLKGVTIGSVKSIKIGVEGDIVYIYMSINLSSLSRNYEGTLLPPRVKNINQLKAKIAALVKDGLCCQFQYEGITGDLFVDIKYIDIAANKPEIIDMPFEHPTYIPLVPAASIGNIMESAQQIASKLNSINFDKISKDFDSLIVSLDEFAKELKLIANKQDVDYMKDRVETTLDKFNDTMNSLNLLVRTLQTQPDSVIWGKTGSKVVPSLNNQRLSIFEL